MIFHNGWWHGNNAVFIRLIDEEATIIIMGNKYTNAVYKAKNLANAFDNYFEVDDEEDAENIIHSGQPETTIQHANPDRKLKNNKNR